MTQYLLSVHVVEGAEAPSEHAMQVAYGAVDTFNAKLQDKGALVFGGGLHPPHTVTVVDATSGDTVVTDGPFAEAKEQIGGFWVIGHPSSTRARVGGGGQRRLRRSRRGAALRG